MTLSNKGFAGLLQRAGTLGQKWHDIQSELTTAFEERYGATYSDIDDDWLIDSLDYGGASVTLEQVDQKMAENGYPRR